MRKTSINLSKLDKSRFYVSPKTGDKWLTIIEVDKPDDYGNDGFVAEDITKEEREKGVKGKIVGNFKRLGKKPAPAPTSRQAPSSQNLDTDGEPIPF